MVNLTIYFSSGNQVTIDKVVEWQVTATTKDSIDQLAISQRAKGFFKCKRRLIVKSINLDNIDCIIEH